MNNAIIGRRVQRSALMAMFLLGAVGCHEEVHVESDLPPALILSRSEGRQELADRFALLQDSEGVLTIRDVVAAQSQHRFHVSRAAQAAFGYTTAVYWV